jgi:hypothetical protein
MPRATQRKLTGRGCVLRSSKLLICRSASSPVMPYASSILFARRTRPPAIKSSWQDVSIVQFACTSSLNRGQSACAEFQSTSSPFARASARSPSIRGNPQLAEPTLIPVRLPYATTRSALARAAGKSSHYGHTLVQLLGRASRFACPLANVRFLEGSTNRSAVAVISANIYTEHACR